MTTKESIESRYQDTSAVEGRQRADTLKPPSPPQQNNREEATEASAAERGGAGIVFNTAGTPIGKNIDTLNKLSSGFGAVICGLSSSECSTGVLNWR